MIGLALELFVHFGTERTVVVEVAQGLSLPWRRTR
jgi:hypothetical protein